MTCDRCSNKATKTACYHGPKGILMADICDDCFKRMEKFGWQKLEFVKVK